MNLSDARDLKRSLTAKLVKRVAKRITERTLDLPAGPLAGAKETPPSLALGVARAGRNDFKLAVRIQQHSRTVDEYLDAIREQAAGPINSFPVRRAIQFPHTSDNVAWASERRLL